MRASFRLFLTLVALIGCGALASALEAFPSKAVHILVPYPPGGGVDIVTRTLGDELSKRWGQSVIVENRPGAGGAIASPQKRRPEDVCAAAELRRTRDQGWTS